MPDGMNPYIKLYSERARVSWLPGGQYQRRRSFFYNWWDTRYRSSRTIKLIIMMLGHSFARRYTAILTSRGFFLLKKPPAEPIMGMNEPELHKYLFATARQQGNDALLYASLNPRSVEKRWGRLIDCWGDVNLFGKWMIVVTANRGTFVISTPDTPLETLAKLNRDALYHLTGE